MKTTIQALFLAVAVAGMMSCEKLKSVADVEFDTAMSTDLDIAVEQATKSTPAGYSYTAEATIDPTSDPEVKKYADKIKKYQVTSLKVVVTGVSESGVTLGQGTWFRISDKSNSAQWVLPGDFDVTVGKSYTLGNENGQWDNVQQILGRNAEFDVASEGTANKNNITIKLEVSIGAKVTANPL